MEDLLTVIAMDTRPELDVMHEGLSLISYQVGVPALGQVAAWWPTVQCHHG